MEKICRRISEIGTVVGGGTPSTKNPDYWGGDIPWISPKDLTDYKSVYISKGENFLTEKGLKSGTRLLPKNTLLFSSRAPIGYVALAANPICTNQGFKSIVCDEKQVVPLYLYYYMKANLDYIKLFGTGATFPEISGKTMGKIKVEIFKSLDVQHRIASILSTYDSLIENNTKRIRLLEKMAENLYKEWFVRFRYHGHENVEMENGLPKGWKRGTLRDIVEFQNGFAFKSDTFCNDGKFSIVTIKNVQAEGFYGSNTDKVAEIPQRMPSYCKLVQGDILLSLTGNIGRVCRVQGNGYLLNQRVAKLKSLFPFYNYCLFKSDYIFQSLNVISYGTAQLNLSPVKALKIRVNIPSKENIEHFEHKVGPMFNKIDNLQHQNSLLARQRDLLLPRLMSGKLEVKEELLE